MSLEIAIQIIEKTEKKKSAKVDLSGLELTEIPPQLSRLSQLTKCNLSRNKLTKIDGLEQLTRLTNLDLSDNELTEISHLERLTHINNLNLGDNLITNIQGLENLTKLTILDLSNNKINLIGNGLDQLTQLISLNLSHNQIIKITGLEKCIQLVDLRLSYNQIGEIVGLEYQKNLRRLLLNANRLAEIKELETLIELMHLDVSNNEIGEIKGLRTLKQLVSLYLNANRIEEIKGLEGLARLVNLGLSNNLISEIKGLENLTQLNKLNLRSNRLGEIKGLEGLFKINDLNLSHNKLAEIKGLNHLKLLLRLRLDENQITELPEYLLDLNVPIFMDSLFYESQFVQVGNNPLNIPSREIIKQGHKAIREYFDQRRKSGDELLNEAKLILLGDGRSGKTSFANRLLKKELPTEIDRTQGVDIIIGAYSFGLANGRTFRINIWDFAGQDKYKTLHQLFYTESSLYVMVADDGNLNTDYDDWFQTAGLFGEGSPLVLVQNEFKTGIGMSSFDSGYWKRQFPDLLKEVFIVNLGTKQNFSAAEEYIKLLAQTLPHTKHVFPANWAGIRRILNGRRNEQYISLKEYLVICKDNGLPDREGALILSSILHKVGDCLHYQRNGLLKQMIILKNEWATEAVYKILDDKVVAESKCGFFSLLDLERIWTGSEYEDMRPQLLELMKQFKLAYQLPGKDEFVTPPLLPPVRPDGFKWPHLESLELFIEYEFLPKALLTQFIVTRHADIADGRTLVWRHGVILKWDDEALAEVSKTKLQGRDAFYIRTQGSNRKGMMTVILKTFRELHGDYKGIKYKEKVPCICEGCKSGRNKQHYFDFVNLKFRVEKGRYEVECDNSLDTINIMELLENSFVFEQFKEVHMLQLKENVVRNGVAEIRTINLFIASSNELLHEREKIEQALNRKNKSLRKDGFRVELLIWEDGKHIGTSLRSQNNYNLDIEECDVFVMLFYSKVGKYTLEEFTLATSLFEKGKLKPRICVFQRDIDLPKNQGKSDSESRFDFMDKLEKMEHFPYLFQNTDQLVNELGDIIDKLLLDESFVDQLNVE